MTPTSGAHRLRAPKVTPLIVTPQGPPAPDHAPLADPRCSQPQVPDAVALHAEAADIRLDDAPEIRLVTPTHRVGSVQDHEKEPAGGRHTSPLPTGASIAGVPKPVVRTGGRPDEGHGDVGS